MKKKNHVTTGDIFDDLYSGEEAIEMKLRSDLMIKIRKAAEAKELTQHQLTKILDVPQSRVSDLLLGKIDKFSVSALIKLASRLGLKVKLVVSKAA